MPKTIIINIFFLFISFSIFSQPSVDIPVELYKEISSVKTLDEYVGSVYVFDNFIPGIIEYEGKKTTLRLNINTYSNSISYINQIGDIYDLNYKSNIFFSIGNQNFIYLKVNGRKMVATALAEKNPSVIYKSYFSKITPPKPSSNGYDLPKPGKIEIKKSYIFLIDGIYTVVDSNKKAVMKAFPELENLIKSKRIRFKSDKDFINFFNLL